MAQFSMEIMRLTGSLLRGNQQFRALAFLTVVMWPSNSYANTYKLVNLIGGTEKVIVAGLSLAECEAKRLEHTAAAEALGLLDERHGIGSIDCLPDSMFGDY